jgi:alkanesulfonate monooxygenase SsuD/methylene tetrahydromethanopterin reductase-like flavin-dependent oxidoreductase (luciferase family)
MKQRGARADEALDVMHTIWKDDPVEFKGRFYSVPASTIQPKPVQKPHPPVYMAAYAPGSMKRVATKADGWLPVALPVPAMQQMWEAIKGMAREAGRNPDELELIVRANTSFQPQALGEGRFIFTGSDQEIKDDIKAVRDLGADEIEFDPTTGGNAETIEDWLDSMEKLRELAG